jgi:hypothetical protein
MKIWQSIEIESMRISSLSAIYAVGYLKIIYDVCKVTDPALMSILMHLLSYGAVALVIAILVLSFLPLSTVAFFAWFCQVCSCLAFPD